MNRPKLVVLALVFIAFLTDYFWFFQENSDRAAEYLNNGIVLAGSTYATCRIINAGVSSLQESSVTVSPFGIGLEYEAGQILDPINDATERLSTLCVQSLALVGTQRILLSAINRYTIVPYYVLLIAFTLLFICSNKHAITATAGRAFLLLLLVRISIPIVCEIGIAMDDQYFLPEFHSNASGLVHVKEIALREFRPSFENKPVFSNTSTEKSSIEQIQRFFVELGKQLRRYYEEIAQRSSNLKEAIQYLADHLDSIALSLTNLFVLLVEKIAMQVIIIPFGIFYLLRWIFRYCTHEKIEHFLRLILKEPRSTDSHQPIAAKS